MNNKKASKPVTSSLLKNEEDHQDSAVSIFICENSDGVLDSLEQMTYALNETQVRYGSIVILKNAP
jgi:hypothetical protein